MNSQKNISLIIPGVKKILQLKDKIAGFSKTDLVKVSFLNGLANILKMLTGLISNKIVAVYLGPVGMGYLGHFHNFISIALSLSNIGITNGVTKYISEFSGEAEKRNKYLSTAFIISSIGGIILSFFIFFFRDRIGNFIFKSSKYNSIIAVFSFTLIFYVLNSLFIAILNGFKQFKKIIITNVLSSVFGLIISISLIYSLNLYGALLSIILTQTLVFFITLRWIISSDWYALKFFLKNFDKKCFVRLGYFSLMAFTALYGSSFIQLNVRSYIMTHISLSDAGIWQGLVRISDMYLFFITSTLSIYYLPRLSELKTNDGLQNEIFLGYKVIIPVVIAISTGIYLFKDTIIQFLFTSSFSGMRNLFLFQLFGNVLKISSFLLSYLMLAKAYTKIFIFSELFFGTSYYLFNVFFINHYGLIGTTYAYCTNYFLYMVFNLIVFKDILFYKRN